MSETPELYNETYPTARKPYICAECRRKIRPGDKYQNIKGCWDGDFYLFETCIPCAELRSEIAATLIEHDDEPVFGQLQEAAQECGFDFPPQPYGGTK